MIQRNLWAFSYSNSFLHKKSIATFSNGKFSNTEPINLTIAQVLVKFHSYFQQLEHKIKQRQTYFSLYKQTPLLPVVFRYLQTFLVCLTNSIFVKFQVGFSVDNRNYVISWIFNFPLLRIVFSNAISGVWS